MIRARGELLAVIIVVLTAGHAFAQGELQPPGPPEPTMRPLAEISERIGGAALHTGAITNGLSIVAFVFWDDFPHPQIPSNTFFLADRFLSVNWPALQDACDDMPALIATLPDWAEVRAMRDTLERIVNALCRPRIATTTTDHAWANLAHGVPHLDARMSNVLQRVRGMTNGLGTVANTASANNAMLRRLANAKQQPTTP